MKNFLFLCSENKFRSPTAEHIFRQFEGISARSAGLNNDAEYPLQNGDIDWADYIFCMDQSHKDKLMSKFGSLLRPDQKVVVLGISDKYQFMDPKLIQEIQEKMKPWMALQSPAFQ